MTQVWQGDKVMAVTRIQAGPCIVVQIKNMEKDGYSAVQLGYGEKKEKNIKKPQIGHLKKIKNQNSNVKTNVRYLREFRDEATNIKEGDVINVNTFQVGDKIKMSGTSKGKGFAGVVKRHGFHGHNTSHGTKDQVRMSGAIGAGGIHHVLKGMRMGGRMGGDKVTVKSSEIVGVDMEKNILLVKGAVPGARNSLVLISGQGELKMSEPLKITENTGNSENKAENINNGKQKVEGRKK